MTHKILIYTQELFLLHDLLQVRVHRFRETKINKNLLYTWKNVS